MIVRTWISASPVFTPCYEVEVMSMDPDRRRRIRRRLWGIAFLGAIALLVWQTLGNHEQIRITLVLDPGRHAPTVTRIEGELVDGDEVLGNFSSNGANPRFSVVVPKADVTVVARITVPGRIVRVRRKITAEYGATITIPVDRELDEATTPPPPP
jgi:hypothetical protein